MLKEVDPVDAVGAAIARRLPGKLALFRARET
jgi:hypothetical protein